MARENGQRGRLAPRSSLSFGALSECLLAITWPPILASMADSDDGPHHEYDRRGLYAEGPKFTTPSDLLGRMIDGAKLARAEIHYAPDPTEERRSLRISRGKA